MINEITFMGSGSCMPTLRRMCSSVLLESSSGSSFLFDCGEGTQLQIAKAKKEMGSISNIFITHLHGDHLYGVFGLLCSMALKSAKKATVNVIGPSGIKKAIYAICPISENGQLFEDSLLKVSFRELHWKKSQSIFLGDIDGFQVSAHPLDHKLPTFGYIVKEKPRLKINVEKAVKLGEQISDIDPNCKKFVFLQDTFESESALEQASNCDILVHECTFEDKYIEQAIMWKHSTAAMAGEYANRAKARNLILTHFSTRYKMDQTESKIFEEEAKRHCPETKVFIAHDLMNIKRQGADFVIEGTEEILK